MFSSLDKANALSRAVHISGEYRSIDQVGEKQFIKLKGFQRNAQKYRQSVSKIERVGCSSRHSSERTKLNTISNSTEGKVKLQKNKNFSVMAQVTHSNVELAPASQSQTMSRLKQHIPETMTRKRFKNEGLAKMRKEGRMELKLELADGTGSVGTFEKENDEPHTSNSLNEPRIIFNGSKSNTISNLQSPNNAALPPMSTRGLASFKVKADSLIHEMEGKNFSTNRSRSKPNQKLIESKKIGKQSLRSVSPTANYNLSFSAGTGGTKTMPKSTKSNSNMMKGARPSASQLGQLSTMQRKWLLKHKKPVDFDLPELKKLRNYFEQLDTDNSGAIGLEELEQPLISLNLCHSRQEVQQLMSRIDVDGNGSIEFDEFLRLIKSAQTCKQAASERCETADKPHSVTRSRNESKFTQGDGFSLPTLRERSQDPLSATLRGHSRQTSGNDLFDKKDKKFRTLIERQNSNRVKGSCAKPPLASQKSPTAEKKEEKSRAIYDFFKDLTSGKLISKKMNEQNFEHLDTMSFDQFCSVFRRKKILKAIMPNTSEEILEKDAKTEEMLRAYKLHLRRLKADSQLSRPTESKETESQEDSLRASGSGAPHFMTEGIQSNTILPNIKMELNDFELQSQQNDPSFVLTNILRKR